MKKSYTAKTLIRHFIFIFIFLLTALISLSCGSLGCKAVSESNSIISSGSCGVNSVFTLYDDGTICINGQGSVDADSFTGNDNIIKAVIGEGITEIHQSAFYNCNNLVSVSLPGTLTLISDAAFGSGEAFNEVIYFGTADSWSCITIGDANERLSEAFRIYACTADSNNVHSMGDWETVAEADCTSDGKMVSACQNCGYTVTEIIYGGHKDSDVNFECDVCAEKYKLKAYCNYDGEVFASIYNDGTLYVYGDINDYADVPDYIEYVYDKDFSSAGLDYYENSITRVVVADGVKSIGSYAFVNFISLREVIIPSSVKTIDSTAFAGSSVTQITVDKSNSYFTFEKGILYNKDKSQLLIYLSSNTEHTFEIPDSVTEIGEKAFMYNGNIVNLAFSESVTSIGNDFSRYADGYTPRLRNIFYSGTQEQWNAISLGSNVDFEGILTVNLSHSHSDNNYNGICDECKTGVKITHYHSYASKTIEATCTETGYTVFTCEGCGGSYIADKTSALGHSLGAYTVAKAPTCIEDGEEIACCIRCAYSETRPVPSDDSHDYISSTVAPDCTENGYTVHSCGLCGDTYTDSFISAVGHIFSSYNKESKVIINNDKTHSFYCLNECGAVGTDEHGEGGKISCSYNILSESLPTCTGKGKTEYACTVCFSTYTELTELLPHNYLSVITAPTCTNEGFTTYNCRDCGAGFIDNVVPATEHISDGGIVTTTPTYDSDGVKAYSCRICGTALGTEKLAKLIAADEDSVHASLETESLTPSQVTGLKAKSVNTNSLKLTWAKADGTDSYIVYYSTNGKKWTELTTNKNTITVKKLRAGTKYRFRVVAVANGKKGEHSRVLTVSTKPAKVTLKTVKSTKAKTAAVVWNTVKGANGYQITYSTSKKFTKKTTKSLLIKKQKVKKTTLKKLKSGKKYFVKVRAYKTVNGKKIYGAYSKVKTIKIK